MICIVVYVLHGDLSSKIQVQLQTKFSALTLLLAVHKSLMSLQIFVDSLSNEVVSVTRHNPVSHTSIILVARTAFGNPSNPYDGTGQPAVHATG